MTSYTPWHENTPGKVIHVTDRVYFQSSKADLAFPIQAEMVAVVASFGVGNL